MEKSTQTYIPYNVDQNRGALIALGDHLEEQFGAGLRQRHEPQLVDDQQIVVGELLLQAQESAFVARLHELVDQRRGGDEAHRERLLARGQSQTQAHMRLARTAWPQSDDVLSALDPLASGELEDLGLVERGDGFELEGVEALDGGELRRLDTPLDETALAVDEFEFHQSGQERHVVQTLVGALARHLVVLAKEGRELEGLEPVLEQDLRRLAHGAPRSIRHR